MSAYVLGALPTYVVKAPVIVLSTLTGERYLYRNAPIPDDADQVHVAHLLEAGLIAERS